MPDKPVLSLCMIVKDEAELLPDCLQSVEDLADEIIIIDTGSTDDTPAIGSKLGGIVISQTWEDHFGQSRNQALERASGEWILILDADERLAKGEAQKLKILLEHLTAKVEGINLTLKNYYGEGLAHQFALDSACRIFRNRQEYRFSRPIHEEISQIILRHRPDAEIFVSDICIEHLGYLEEVLKRKEKSQRNSRILQHALAESPNDSFLNYAYGTECFQKQDYTTALKYYQKAEQYSTKDCTFLPDLSYKMAVSFLKKGELLQGRKLVDHALLEYPDFSALWYVKGEIHYLQEEWELAKNAYEWCLRLGVQPIKYLYIHGLDSFHSLWALGKVCEKMSDEEGAFDYYIRSYTANSQYEPAYSGIRRIIGRVKKRVFEYLDLSMVDQPYDLIYDQMKHWLKGDDSIG